MSAADEPLPTQGQALVLEDDEGLAQLLGSVIGWMYAGVVVCRDVDTALAAVQNREFDVLVVDIGVGRQSGLDFLRAARAAGSMAPAVVTTGLADELSQKSIKGLGIEVVLRKPYPLETLEAALHDVTRSASEMA